jgi:hypothetical protein
MTGQELTREEVLALAGAFSRVDSARTLLRLARFPGYSVPENGYANGLEFWGKISEALESGVMPEGRRKIFEAACALLPANEKLAALAAAAAGSAPPHSVPAATSINGGHGIQVGNNNMQINFLDDRNRPAQEPFRASAASSPQDVLRVLVIGASPLDPDLPHIRADREAHAIERVAGPDRIELQVILGAEATDLSRVGVFRPDVLHFVCHGAGHSLVFNDAGGESDYVTAARVAQLLHFYRDTAHVKLRGLVLAACDGDKLAPFFVDVADTVIAHRGRLPDQCGVAFAEHLYTRLSAPGDHSGAESPDLAGIAREAAQLTAQYSAACDPVIANLIVLTGD